MAMIINTNISAIAAQNSLRSSSLNQQTSMERLSSGLRINNAKDDAAGLAISTRMTAAIRGMDAAMRNANDGISMAQTAESALGSVTNMLQRMRELAVQATSDTVSSIEKGYLNTEYSQLLEEINRIGANTEWNGDKILDQSGGLTSGSGVYVFQIGANSGQTISVTIDNMSTSGAFSGVSSAISSAAAASSAISTLDDAIDAIADQRARIGAAINRLTYAADNLSNISQNVSESRSRVLDTDYAKASSELARTQIIQQAATAILAQANTDQQTVLQLLKG